MGSDRHHGWTNKEKYLQILKQKIQEKVSLHWKHRLIDKHTNDSLQYYNNHNSINKDYIVEAL